MTIGLDVVYCVSTASLLRLYCVFLSSCLAELAREARLASAASEESLRIEALDDVIGAVQMHQQTSAQNQIRPRRFTQTCSKFACCAQYAIRFVNFRGLPSTMRFRKEHSGYCDLPGAAVGAGVVGAVEVVVAERTASA